jgi:hypothetical protein
MANAVLHGLALAGLLILGCSSSSPDTGAGTGSGNDGAAAADSGEHAASGDSGEPSQGPGSPLTVTDYCNLAFPPNGPWCQYVAMCCSSADQVDPAFLPPACNNVNTASNCASGLETTIQRGNVVFDGTWASSCSADLLQSLPDPPAGGCSGAHIDLTEAWLRHSQAFDQIEACRRMVAGKLHAGDPCNSTAECPLADICSTGNGTASGTYTCIPAGTTGSPCIEAYDCAAGLTCVGPTPGRHCAMLQPLGGPCSGNTECQDGLVCSPSWMCVEAKPLGAACTPYDVCTMNAGCDFLGTSTCVPLGTPAAHARPRVIARGAATRRRAPASRSAAGRGSGSISTALRCFRGRGPPPPS